MTVGVQPGQPPLKPQQESGLAAALSRVGPPSNPKTVAQRTDPQYQWLSKMHGIRRALDECLQEAIDDRPPGDQTIVTAMRHAADRLIRGVDGTAASFKLASEVLQEPAPALAQQCEVLLDQSQRAPMVSGAPQITGMGQPPMGGAPGPGATPPPQGMAGPQMGGVPVPPQPGV